LTCGCLCRRLRDTRPVINLLNDDRWFQPNKLKI